MARLTGQSVVELCIYCGQEADTRDHVPPKLLFPKPRTKMVTVPACLQCNKSYEKDDVLFAVASCLDAYIEHPQAMHVWESSLRPHILKRPRFRSMLASNIMPGRVVTPTGVYLPDRVAVRFSKERLTRVVGRIVRGLLWEHYKQITDPGIEIEVYRNPALDPDLAEIVNLVPNHSWIGGDIFRYRYGLAENGQDTSFWAMQFYANTEYLAVVMGSSFKE